MNEELLKIVKRKTKRGYPEGELRNELRLQGMSESEINELFDAITKSDNSTAGYGKVDQPQQTRLLIGACLAITGIALLSVNTDNSTGWLLIILGVIFLLPSVFKQVSKEFKRD